MSEAEPKYSGRIDRRVRNNAHSIAFEQIETFAAGRALRVLDVGCAGGYFGAALRADGHRVWGVEPDPVAAATAERALDGVFRGGIEEFLASGAGDNERFDVLVFGDVLEHAVDSVDILRRCRRLLAADGVVVASVPNVAHLAVRLMLLAGRWDYDERGIMDRTHLRFFTRASIAETFGAGGYEVEAIFPVRVGLEETGIAVDARTRAWVGDAVRDAAADVFQYVVLARLAAGPAAVAANRRYRHDAGPRVLAISPLPDWTIGELRLRRPLSAWQSWYGGEVRFGWIGALRQDDVDWADVLVLQREADPNILSMIDGWHRQDKRVVLDIDDLLTEMPPFLSSYHHARRNRPHLQAALRAVDAVATTTTRLAREFSTYASSVFVVPNCPLPVATPARHWDDGEQPVRLFVASSDSVRVDFLVPALQRLLSDPQLKLALIGIGPPGLALREAGLPIATIDNLRYEDFGHFLAAHDNAIGLIPLDDSRFSGCKSAIKFHDYAQAGLPTVCSNVPPYADIVEDGLTGLLVGNDVDAWCVAVARLARSAVLRQRIAAAARASANAGYSARVAADAWNDLLNDVLARPPNPVVAWPAGKPTQPPRLRRWARQAVDPLAWRAAAAVWRQEGIAGVRRRLLRP